jgi:hypothetical protein
MGLFGFAKTTEFIEVPLRVDSALDMTKEEYEAFLKSGCDRELLKLHPGQTPIFFKLRKTLPYYLKLRVEDMKMEVVKRKQGDQVTNELVPRMSFLCEEVRFSIVDIINPPELPEDHRFEFKRDSDGLCADEIMAKLMEQELHMDLWTARQTQLKTVRVNKKK